MGHPQRQRNIRLSSGSAMIVRSVSRAEEDFWLIEAESRAMNATEASAAQGHLDFGGMKVSSSIERLENDDCVPMRGSCSSYQSPQQGHQRPHHGAKQQRKSDATSPSEAVPVILTGNARLRHRGGRPCCEAPVGTRFATEQCYQMRVLKILSIGSAAVSEQRFARPRVIFYSRIHGSPR